jgi:succinoglycan biosynthesis transport protein ExoP
LNDDLRFYIGILKRRYLPFLAVFTVVSAIATIGVLSLSPVYRSLATILVETQTFSVGDKPTMGTAEERIQITRQKVSAREELLRIAEKFNLFPGSRQTMSATKLVDAMRSRITIEPAELKGARQIGSNTNSIAFSVGFDDESPEKANKVASELLDMILTEDISQQTAAAREAVAFLTNEQQRLGRELNDLEETITKFKLENQDKLPDRIPFQMQSLERSETNRKEIDREIDSLVEEKRLLELELTLRESQNGLSSNSPNSIESQLAAAKSELALKRATLTKTHPDVQRLERVIKQLEEQNTLAPEPTASEQKDSETTKQKMGIDARVAAEKRDAIDRKISLYQSQKQSIQGSIATLTKILNDSPEVQGKIVEYERHRTGLQKSIDDIGDKLAKAILDLKIIEQQHGERLRVIEQPIVPQDPIWPKVPKLLAMGYGLAAVAGGGLAGLLEFLNRSVRSASDIVKALNRHPMVVVPYIMTKEEGRRKFRKYVYVFAAILAAIILAVLAVHFFFMRIDDLFYKVIFRLGF